MTVANRTLMNSISWSTLSDILANLDGSGPIILISCGTSLCAMVQNLFMAFIVLIKKRHIFMNTTLKSWTIFLLQKKLYIHKNGLAFWNMFVPEDVLLLRFALPELQDGHGQLRAYVIENLKVWGNFYIMALLVINA